MVTFFTIWGAITGTVGLVMSFARTGPEEARSKLSEWAQTFGFKKVAAWLAAHAVDPKVLKYGKWAMAVLLFVGGIGVGHWWDLGKILPPKAFPPTMAVAPPKGGSDSFNS
jgi:hypothetical protein